jgi:ArsR family transcriptional regulator
MMSAPADSSIQSIAELFKVLGHPERIRLVARLAAGSTTTQHELLSEVPRAQSTLARHVSLLRERGIVRATRRGNEVHLHLTNDLAPRLLQLVRAYVAHHPERPRTNPSDPSAELSHETT